MNETMINENTVDNIDDEMIDIPTTSLCSDYIEDSIITLDVGNVSNVVLDKKLFEKGIQEMSELCGKITALTNVGITPSMALSFIADKESADKLYSNNLEVSKLNANATVESSKYGMASISKMTV